MYPQPLPLVAGLTEFSIAGLDVGSPGAQGLALMRIGTPL